MDFKASPLPAGSLATNKPRNDGVDLTIGVKARNQNQDFDDSSSIISGSIVSMPSTSSSKSVQCRVCGDPEVLPSRPFVKCTQCRKVWHLGCHTPDLDRTKAHDPCFICGLCTQKAISTQPSGSKQSSTTDRRKSTPALASTEHAAGLSTSSSRKTISTSDTGPASNSIPNHLPHQKDSSTSKSSHVLCSNPGCQNPISYSSSNKTLCWKHEIEQRHAKAKAQQPIQNVNPASKPFNKKKMHPVKPDDKPFLKRKRADIPKKKPASNDVDMLTKSPKTFKTAAAPNHNGFAFSIPLKAARVIAEDKTNDFTSLRTQGHNRNQSLSSVSMVESPVEQGPPSLSATVITQDRPETGNLPMKPSPIAITRDANLSWPRPVIPSNDSPEYEPPPPQVSGVENLWTREDEEGDSPGSQIAQEFRANVEGSQQHSSQPLLSPVQEQPAGNDPHAKSNNPLDTMLEEVNVEGGEDFLGNGTLIDRLASEHALSPDKGRTQRAPSLAEAILSPTLLSDRGLDRDSDEIMNDDQLPEAPPEAEDRNMDEGWTTIDRPLTCTERRLARGAIDESVLDAFLEQQRKQNTTSRPTKAELDNVNWGFIDPRKDWPEPEMTTAQIAAKTKQIEARGGRKAGLGKFFTAVKLQEQAEKGWERHQSCDKKDDEETMQAVRHLEELFGIQNLANLVPATINGRLVMIDREVPDDGKKRKKSEPRRVFPVFGAPNTM